VVATEGLQAVSGRQTGEEDSGSADIIGELSRLLGELKTMNDDVVGLVKEIERGSRALSDLVEDTIDQITVHKDLAREVAGLSLRFDEVITWAKRSVSPEELEKARGLSLEYIENNYTMQRERIIHESVASKVIPFAGKGRVNAPAPPVEEDVAVTDDLGDNVELF